MSPQVPHRDFAGVRLPSSYQPPPVPNPPRHSLAPALSSWVQRRGKPMMALFGFLGTCGTIYGGAVTAYVKYGPKPWENPLARIEAVARTVELNNQACMLTLGTLTPRVVRLEEHDIQHAEALASLRPIVRVNHD